MQKESPQSESCPWRHKLAKKHILVCKIAELEIVCGEKLRGARSLLFILQMMITKDSIIESLYLENIFDCTRVGLFLF